MNSTYIPIRHAYLRVDIQHILASHALTASHSNRGAEYAAGVADTLEAIAVALGIDAPALALSAQPAAPRMVTVDAETWTPARQQEREKVRR